jgi:hypothetical protein
VMDSGISTSMVTGEALLEVCYRTQRWLGGKWFVPASELNGGSSDHQLDGGDREGPDCFCKSFSGVFSTIARDLCVISSFYKVFCNLLYIHRGELMNAFRPFGHSR